MGARIVWRIRVTVGRPGIGGTMNFEAYYFNVLILNEYRTVPDWHSELLREIVLVTFTRKLKVPTEVLHDLRS